MKLQPKTKIHNTTSRFTLGVLPGFSSLRTGILAPGVKWLVYEFDRSPGVKWLLCEFDRSPGVKLMVCESDRSLGVK